LSSYLPFGQSEDEELLAKMNKLTIVEEREEDKYDHVTNIKYWTCDPENGIIVPDSANV
jgi:ubiquitin carboxyl-terminal hydrolase 5/13